MVNAITPDSNASPALAATFVALEGFVLEPVPEPVPELEPDPTSLEGAAVATP